MARWRTLLVVFISVLVGLLYIIETKYIRLSEHVWVERRMPMDFPRVRYEDNFLTREECAELKEYVTNLPVIHESDLGPLFKGTYGFNLTFCNHSLKYDIKNVNKVFKIDFEPIRKLYKRIKHPDANACLFNPLIIHTSTPKRDKDTANPHYDLTLQVRSACNRMVVPICTTVLYIDIPNEFMGGRLGLRNFADQTDDGIYLVPKLGRKVTFRGDQLHHVETMFTEFPSTRISLVFEQYKLTAEEIDKYAAINFE